MCLGAFAPSRVGASALQHQPLPVSYGDHSFATLFEVYGEGILPASLSQARPPTKISCLPQSYSISCVGQGFKEYSSNRKWCGFDGPAQIAMEPPSSKGIVTMQNHCKEAGSIGADIICGSYVNQNYTTFLSRDVYVCYIRSEIACQCRFFDVFGPSLKLLSPLPRRKPSNNDRW